MYYVIINVYVYVLNALVGDVVNAIKMKKRSS